jgi:poly(hydroxyalkanoate) granule-associated protein
MKMAMRFPLLHDLEEVTMTDELVHAGNGASGSTEPVKKATRKSAKKVEELKMNKSEASAEIEKVEATAEATVDEAKAVVEQAATDVQETAVDAEKLATEAVEEVKVPTNGTEAEKGIKKIVKDASAQVDRLPGSKQVKGAVVKVADQVGSAEVTKKTVRTVRDAADSVKHGAQELDKNPLVVAAHKVLLASIGAAALAQEEIEDFVNRLVERGSIAEADGKRMVKDVLDQRRKQMERAGERAQEVAGEITKDLTEGPKKIADDLEQRIEGVLTRMNIPTKEEIETLTSKITALTRKVDELKKSE